LNVFVHPLKIHLYLNSVNSSSLNDQTVYPIHNGVAQSKKRRAIYPIHVSTAQSPSTKISVLQLASVPSVDDAARVSEPRTTPDLRVAVTDATLKTIHNSIHLFETIALAAIVFTVSSVWIRQADVEPVLVFGIAECVVREVDLVRR
jgi:hypothetical protein